MTAYNRMPHICQYCKSERIKSTVVDSLDVGVGVGLPMEVRYDCEDCKRAVDYWAHGMFESGSEPRLSSKILLCTAPSEEAWIDCPCSGLHTSFEVSRDVMGMRWEVTCLRCKKVELIPWELEATKL